MTLQKRAGDAGPPPRLLVSGSVYLAGAAESPVVATRGMSIVSRDGPQVGKVAAVVVDGHSQEVTHILLCRLPEAPDYRLVLPSQVARVTGETMLLHIHSQEVDSLPVHRAS